MSDNFLDNNLEASFRTHLIYELARQDVSISDKMVGGAFQFGDELFTNKVTIKVHGINERGEVLYSIPFPGDHVYFYSAFPDCPEKLAPFHLRVSFCEGFLA